MPEMVLHGDGEIQQTLVDVTQMLHPAFARASTEERHRDPSFFTTPLNTRDQDDQWRTRALKEAGL